MVKGENMKPIKKLILAAMLMAIGLVLPFFTAQVKEIGDSLLPMHFPVMLCGLVCGPWYGFGVGVILPLFRSVLFSMPPIYPNAVWMALELATYGGVIGFCYHKSPRKNIVSVFYSLILAMLFGRIVWGISKTILLGISGKAFGFQAFLAGGFLDALPGIILQLILIPSIMVLLQKNNHVTEERINM